MSKHFGHNLLAILEYLPHVALDEKLVNEPPAGYGVIDLVAHQRLVPCGDERVLVVPVAIRPAQLPVGEAKRRFPIANLRAPANGNAMQPQAVIDQRASVHVDRPGRDDLKIQPRRRDRFQVERIGEEVKDFCLWARQAKFGQQAEGTRVVRMRSDREHGEVLVHVFRMNRDRLMWQPLTLLHRKNCLRLTYQ